MSLSILCSSLSPPQGLQSSSSPRSSRQAPTQWPASAACSKASQGRSASWSTSCSRTSQSSLCLVSLCEWIWVTAVHWPEQTSILPSETLSRPGLLKAQSLKMDGGMDGICLGIRKSYLSAVAVDKMVSILCLCWGGCSASRLYQIHSSYCNIAHHGSRALLPSMLIQIAAFCSKMPLSGQNDTRTIPSTA